MTDPEDYYLGREGKIFGPFDAEEMGRLRASGEIRKYIFIWNHSTSAWTTIESPPPPPLRAWKMDSSEQSERELRALCHDSRFAMVQGRLRNFSETGGDLVTEDPGETPSFALRSSVTLNVSDPKSGKSLNLTVRLKDVLRNKTGWTYRIRWDQPPKFD